MTNRPFFRPRRLRNNVILREAVSENHLRPEMLIYPAFVHKQESYDKELSAMPGIRVEGPDLLVKSVEHHLALGLNKILLFGSGDEKFEDARAAWDFRSAVPTAIRRLKAEFGQDLLLIADVCACAYTTHGHCGYLDSRGVDNDRTLELLAKIALTYAEAGVDVIAPSDMMDGRVRAIREALDRDGFTDTAIMSYTVKYASAYYGPFREAADSAPSHGDRRGYQMDFRNSRDAMREVALDTEEGADILMVKPALAYLDIIRQVREQSNLPLACYNVSGEYSLIKHAARQGLIDERAAVMENMAAFMRAGADLIISYHSRDILTQRWI